MATTTQDMRYRLSLIRCAQKDGVSKAAARYRTNRQYIINISPQELKLIADMRRRNPHNIHFRGVP